MLHGDINITVDYFPCNNQGMGSSGFTSLDCWHEYCVVFRVHCFIIVYAKRTIFPACFSLEQRRSARTCGRHVPHLPLTSSVQSTR